MERKIGEIFEYNGEWHQCVESDGTCNGCVGTFQSYSFCNDFEECVGKIFKKLEKVGEPYEFDGHLFQSYRTFEVPIFTENYATVRELGNNSKISIEIKQKQEDMEEKTQLPKEDNPLTRLVYNYVSGKISDKELIKSIKEMSDEYLYNKNSLKPFDLETAKAGKPVCTRDGRKARIICFDTKGDLCPIIALIEENNIESAYHYDKNGQNAYKKSGLDLMMLPEKKEGWINIYNADTTFYYADGRVFETKGEAVQEAKEEVEKEQREKNEYIDTIRVEWEE